MDECKFSLGDNGLTLYHAVLTFNNPEKGGVKIYFWKRRKCWIAAFSPCPKMFSTLPKTSYNFLFPFIVSSASAFIWTGLKFHGL